MSEIPPKTSQSFGADCFVIVLAALLVEVLDPRTLVLSALVFSPVKLSLRLGSVVG